MNGEYERADAEQAVIGRILELREKGSTWQAVADTMNGDQVPPPSGAEWYSMTVRRIALAALEARKVQG